MPTVSTSRVELRFRELRERGAKGLVIYLTAGDPTLDGTGKLLAAVDRGGADVIELGVPFSDPLADGPVIQRASERALKAGSTLGRILERAPLPGNRQPCHRRAVEEPEQPVRDRCDGSVLVAAEVVNDAGDAARAGAAGALIVDLAPEEAGAYVQAMRAKNLDTVFLAAPTSTDERLARLVRLSTGFLYLISRPGTTGARSDVSGALGPLIERARRHTELPLAVGFGVSNPAQVREVAAKAEAAVVGSALVRAIEERYAAGGPNTIEQFVRWLREGTDA